MRTRAILAAVVLFAALPVLAAAQALTGRVVDANTQRTIEADITVVIETASGVIVDGADAASGDFAMGGLPAGSAVVYAVSDGYSPGWASASLTGTRTQTVRFSLKLEAGVSGTVVNGQGQPVGGAFIDAEYSDEVGANGLLDSLGYGQRVTNASGEFRLLGLVADTTVTLYAETESGARSAPVTASTTAGFTREGIVLQVP